LGSKRDGGSAGNAALLRQRSPDRGIYLTGAAEQPCRDGLFVEHWDELNTLEVFQQIGAVEMRGAGCERGGDCPHPGHGRGVR
jgi:hypothetical protein